MRIGINALYLLPGKVGGSETYIRNLVQGMERYGVEHEYFIFVNQESRGLFEQLTQSMKIILCPVKAVHRPLRILWEQIALPFQVRRHRIDVLLSAGMTAPFLCPATSIVVIYDLQHIHHPQNFEKVYLLFLKWILYLSAKTANGILTISHKVKQDILLSYKIPSEKVGVTYLGIDHDLFNPRDPEVLKRIRKKYGLPDRFILYPATTLPHKNHKRLLAAFRRVQEQISDLKLVLIGARDKGEDLVRKHLLESGLREEDVVFLGWLPFEDIPAVYCAAEIFVFPSLYEGFGFPVIEAMGCGIPVVCSNIEPIREVAGDAAFFIDPYDPGSIAEGILTVLKDAALRHGLVEKGLQRAKAFTWRETALATLSYVVSLQGRA